MAFTLLGDASCTRNNDLGPSDSALLSPSRRWGLRRAAAEGTKTSRSVIRTNGPRWRRSRRAREEAAEQEAQEAAQEQAASCRSLDSVWLGRPRWMRWAASHAWLWSCKSKTHARVTMQKGARPWPRSMR